MATSEVRLLLESRPAEVRRIGETLRKVCAALHLSVEEGDRLELAVAEAVTNVFRHAYGGRAGNTVEIRIMPLTHRLVIEVRDRGQPMAPEVLEGARLPEVERLRPDELREGGMGLAIVKTVMDEVDYRSEGGVNVFRLVKRLGHDG